MSLATYQDLASGADPMGMERNDMIAHDDKLMELLALQARAESLVSYHSRLARSGSWVGVSRVTPEQAEAATEAVRQARAAVIAHEGGYEGWSRFFHVTNANGHIHRNMSCSTCRFDTQYAFRTDLSGLTEDDAVDAIGPVLCSVCFPSAPVEKTNGVSHANAAARSDRAAAKSAALAKKLEKCLIEGEVDGYFRTGGSRGDRIKTIAAAKSWLTDGWDWGWDHPSFSVEDRQALAELLALRTGKTAEEEIADAAKRAAKRK